MINKKFGRLTVIKEETESIKGRRVFECICDCGKKKIIAGKFLRNGHTKSCGCLSRDIVIKRNTSHGMSKTRIYKTWCGMRERCESSTAYDYKWYGGRGIKVCKRWSKFENFLVDMEIGYKNNLTLDRINPNGDYEKKNCRWIPQSEQNHNKRNNVLFKYKNTILNIQQWTEFLGISRGVFERKIKNNTLDGFSPVLERDRSKKKSMTEERAKEISIKVINRK